MNSSPNFNFPFAYNCAMRADVPVPQGERSMAFISVKNGIFWPEEVGSMDFLSQ